MKITRTELAKILKEETDRFNSEPSEKYLKLLEGDVVDKTANLKEKLTKKLNEVKLDKKEKAYLLEEILEQLKKIYTIL